MRLDLIIKKPLITEKTMQLAAMGKFTFEVDLHANKHMIIKAVEDHFKVNVEEISIVNTIGKIKRFGSRRKLTQLSKTKKAVLTLKKGQKIDLFEIKEEK